MAKDFVYDPNSKQNSFSRIYGGVFCVFVVILGTLIFSLIRTDTVTNRVLENKNIPFLLIISDENGPLLSQAVLFHAKTRRLALIDIPPEAGDLLPQLKRSDRYSVFYRENNKAAYRQSIEDPVFVCVGFAYGQTRSVDRFARRHWPVFLFAGRSN